MRATSKQHCGVGTPRTRARCTAPRIMRPGKRGASRAPRGRTLAWWRVACPGSGCALRLGTRLLGASVLHRVSLQVPMRRPASPRPPLTLRFANGTATRKATADGNGRRAVAVVLGGAMLDVRALAAGRGHRSALDGSKKKHDDATTRPHQTTAVTLSCVVCDRACR